MLNKRAAKVLQLAGKDLDGVYMTSPENVRYLTGFSGTEGSILLTKDSGFFLTDGRYTLQADEQVKDFKVIIFKEKWKTLGKLIKKSKIQSVGYESNNLTLTLLDSIQKEAGNIRFVPLEQKLSRLRAMKDRGEVRFLKKAATIAAESLEEVIPLIRPGVEELEIAAELEYRMRKKGGESIAFETIVASGYRSALPHGCATDKKIKRGELVTIDYGTVYNGYTSDETCTFVVGKPTKKQEEVYSLVKKAHDLALEKIRPGRKIKSIDTAARRPIETAGFGKYFNHGTGHGVGLCVHEDPVVSFRSKDEIKPGMVFTVEPGIYIPKWGGVRIEDTVLVKKQAFELITKTDKTLRCVGL